VIYHPIKNLREPVNLDVTCGFVSMSDITITYFYVANDMTVHVHVPIDENRRYKARDEERSGDNLIRSRNLYDHKLCFRVRSNNKSKFKFKFKSYFKLLSVVIKESELYIIV
jgi:endo-1,4-beta-D-glucanase Y